MRAALLVVALTACATVPAGPPPMANEDAPIDTSAGACDATPAQRLLGQPATQALGAEALRLSGAEVLRWAPPGAALTMDYRMERLTVAYSADKEVTEVRCG